MTAIASIACAQCDYDLRGNSAGANCPERGLPTTHSAAYWGMVGGQSRRWLWSLRAGLLLILASILLLPTMVLDDYLRELYRKALGMDLMDAYLVNELLEAGIALLMITGVWLLTRRPGRDASWRYPALCLRGLSLLLLTLPVIEHLARAHIMKERFGGALYVWLMSMASIGGFALCTIIASLLAWQLRQIATRFRAANLAQHARIVQWGWTILPASIFAMMLLSLAIESYTGLNRRIDNVFIVVWMIVFCGIIVVSVWGLITILRLLVHLFNLHRQPADEPSHS